MFERTYKLHSGGMYMMPLDNPLYALIPKRRWYAPWLWDLDSIEIVNTGGGVFETSEARILISNLRRAEVIGLMKMLGALNVGN
jgi:hypothetical protein